MFFVLNRYPHKRISLHKGFDIDGCPFCHLNVLHHPMWYLQFSVYSMANNWQVSEYWHSYSPSFIKCLSENVRSITMKSHGQWMIPSRRFDRHFLTFKNGNLKKQSFLERCITMGFFIILTVSFFSFAHKAKITQDIEIKSLYVAPRYICNNLIK